MKPVCSRCNDTGKLAISSESCFCDIGLWKSQPSTLQLDLERALASRKRLIGEVAQNQIDIENQDLRILELEAVIKQQEKDRAIFVRVMNEEADSRSRADAALGYAAKIMSEIHKSYRARVDGKEVADWIKDAWEEVKSIRWGSNA